MVHSQSKKSILYHVVQMNQSYGGKFLKKPVVLRRWESITGNLVLITELESLWRRANARNVSFLPFTVDNLRFQLSC